MVEVEIRIKSTGKYEIPKAQLFIKDSLVENVLVHGSIIDAIPKLEIPAKKVWYLSTSDINAMERILALGIWDIPQEVYGINFNRTYPWMDLITSVKIDISREVNVYHIVFEVKPDLVSWARPYSFSAYLLEFENKFNALKGPGLEQFGISKKGRGAIGGIRWEEFDMALNTYFTGETFKDVMDKATSFLPEVHLQTVKSLMLSLNQNSYIRYFDFPDEVRVYCEQYLQYFIQFLRDLGVEATSELRHEEGHVLFSVTPVDKDQALDNIRAALDVYLSLPSGKLIYSQDDENAIEIQRLVGTIQHLESQITLERAVRQAKDATIQAQQITITQQQRLLADNILTESIIDITPQPQSEDRIEIVRDIVSITKYKGKWFEIDLPKMFKKFKKVFDKK